MAYQVAVKLGKFEYGKRDEIEKIYMTLNWEVITRVRPGYEYGWKFVKEKISHMFSHSVLMEMISHNIENAHLDYIDLFIRMNGAEEDADTAEDVKKICDKYRMDISCDVKKIEGREFLVFRLTKEKDTLKIGSDR